MKLTIFSFLCLFVSFFLTSATDAVVSVAGLILACVSAFTLVVIFLRKALISGEPGSTSTSTSTSTEFTSYSNGSGGSSDCGSGGGSDC